MGFTAIIKVFNKKSKRKTNESLGSGYNQSYASYVSSSVSTRPYQASTQYSSAQTQPYMASSSSSTALPQPSTASTQSSAATRLTSVSDEKEFAPQGSRLPPQDNRFWREPQGRATQRISRTCPRCGSSCIRLPTRDNNPDNAGRYFIKCTKIGCIKFNGDRNQWVCWDDDIGIWEGNPSCYCNPPKPSRQSRSNADKGHKVYYECARGECDLWEQHVDERGAPVFYHGSISHGGSRPYGGREHYSEDLTGNFTRLGLGC